MNTVKAQTRSTSNMWESATRDESLIFPMRVHGRRHPPLFCIGGITYQPEQNDGLFGNLTAVLQTDRAVYALGYRCADNTASRLTVESVAAMHLKEILNVQPHGPYYLIGYSIGALLAYEVANVLASRGEDVGLLGLIDMFNPALYRDRSSEAVEFRKRYRQDRLKKYLDNLRRGDLQQLVSDASKLLLGRTQVIIQSVFGGLFAKNRPDMLGKYSPTKFRGHMVLFRVEKPMDGGTEFEQDPSLGWNSYAKGGVDVKVVTGDHGTLMRMPHIIDLAIKLAPYLDEQASSAELLGD